MLALEPQERYLLTYNVHEIEISIGCQARYKTAQRKGGNTLGEYGGEIPNKTR